MKLAGQSFWHFISDDPDFYMRIIEPMGHNARAQNETFLLEYSSVLNILTARFLEGFSRPDGKIDWPKLVEFNSKSNAKAL